MKAFAPTVDFSGNPELRSVGTCITLRDCSALNVLNHAPPRESNGVRCPAHRLSFAYGVVIYTCVQSTSMVAGRSSVGRHFPDGDS